MSKENQTPKPTKEEKRAAAEQAKAAKAQAKEEKKQLALADKQAKQQEKQLKKQQKKGGGAEQRQAQSAPAAPEQATQATQSAQSEQTALQKPTKKQLYAWSKETREEWKKLPRKERKLREEQQLALEKKLIAEGKIRPRAEYRPRGAFWRIFATTLAFFFGIFGALGSLVGTVVFMTTKSSTRDLLAGFGIDNVDQLLTEKYYNLTPLRLAQELAAQLGSMPINSLETLSEISPLIPHYLDVATQELAELGVHVSSEELTKLEFTQISEYLRGTVVPAIALGEVLQLDKDVTMKKLEDQALFYTLCYGTFGTNYTIGASSASPTGYSTTEGETSPGGTIAMIGESKPTTMDDLLGEGEGKSINNLLKRLSLGSALGLDINVTDKKIEDSSMLYTLCYGAKDVDYEITANKTIHLLREEPATTFEKLIDSSSSLLDSLELGSMLGLNTKKELDNRKNNALMYALAYGTEGSDYEVVDDKIVMLGGALPKTIADMTKNSTEIINGIQLDSILDINAKSDAIMRYLAYGPEMAKDEDGNYLMDADDRQKYATEPIYENNAPTDKLQYAGGGRYVIKEDESGNQTIEMLPDPNDETKTYAKKTLGDLTKEDADLLDGMKIGDIMSLDSESSGLMQAIKDWSIDDLTKQEKIESLTIGEIMQIEPDENGNKPSDVSNIMWALRDRSIEELQQQETIDSLKLGDVLDIKPDSTGILKAMSSWSISDLGEQDRINRLRLGQVLEIKEGSSRLMQAMKDWRIDDLTKQEKIDSLTLGDVLEIETEGPDASPKILQSLANEPIGSLGDNINTMRLSDILEPEDFEGNKILRNLKMSSLETLSEDVQTLSVKDVFGDELYSYMEITDGKGYLETIMAYDPSAEKSARPEIYEFEEGQTAEIYHMYEKAGAEGVPVSLTWFDADGNHYMESDIYRGTRAAQGGPDAKEFYYFVKSHVAVEATFTWMYIEENENFALKALPENDKVGNAGEAPEGIEVTPYAGTDGYKENREQLYYFTAAGEYYPLLTDGYDIYYTYTSSRGDTNTVVRVDLERTVSYTKGGEPVDAAKVLHGDGAYYVVEEKEVTQKWCDASFKTYDETDGGKIVERYRITKDGKIVELDRYLAGVWALLFAHVEYDVGEGSTNTGKVVKIEEQTEKPILDISADITNVAGDISSTELWKLYLFHILEAEPFVDISTLNITLYAGTDNAKTVTNLNQCNVVECIELVMQLTEKLSGFGG